MSARRRILCVMWLAVLSLLTVGLGAVVWGGHVTGLWAVIAVCYLIFGLQCYILFRHPAPKRPRR